MLLDSNIIIYAIQPEHEIVRKFLAQDSSQVSAISLVEVLGYSKLTPADEANLRTVFSAFSVLQVTIDIIEGAIALRRRRSMSLGDAINRSHCPGIRVDIGYSKRK